jgi:hypothetical protein
MNCVICENEAIYRWTDTHGIGACITCGAPYRLFHYDENNERVDKPVECLVLEDWRELVKRYWDEMRMNVAPGHFNIPGSSYEVATQEEVANLDEWMERNRESFPTTEAVEA